MVGVPMATRQRHTECAGYVTLPGPANVVHAELVGVAGPGRRGLIGAAVVHALARIVAVELVVDGGHAGVAHAPAPMGLGLGRGRNDQGHGHAPRRVIVGGVPRLARGLAIGEPGTQSAIARPGRAGRATSTANKPGRRAIGEVS